MKLFLAYEVAYFPGILFPVSETGNQPEFSTGKSTGNTGQKTRQTKKDTSEGVRCRFRSSEKKAELIISFFFEFTEIFITNRGSRGKKSKYTCVFGQAYLFIKTSTLVYLKQ